MSVAVGVSTCFEGWANGINLSGASTGAVAAECDKRKKLQIYICVKQNSSDCIFLFGHNNVFSV